MPQCRDCGTYIRFGQRCDQHRVEHTHGTLDDVGTVDDGLTDIECAVCENAITPGEPITSVRGEPAHPECRGEVRCDGSGWQVEQQGLDGEAATGQTTLDGGVSKDGAQRD